MIQNQEQQERSNLKLTWIIGAIIAVFIIVGLVIYKLSHPDIAWGKFLLWIGIVIVFYAGAAGGFTYYYNLKHQETTQKESKDKELPPAISTEAARQRAADILFEDPFAENIAIPLDEHVGHYGKSKRSTIYTYIGKGDDNENTVYCVMVNMNFPDRHVVLINPDEKRIWRAQNSLAVDPEEEPEEKTTLRENILTGAREVIKEPIKKEEKKEEKADTL